MYPRSPCRMQEKRIGPDLSCARCLGHKPELEAALARIRYNLSWVAARFERTFYVLAYRLGMIVRSAALTAVFCGVPLPLFFGYHMMAEHDGSPGTRHEALEERCLTLVECVDGNNPDIAACDGINDGVHNRFTMGHYLLSVEGNKRKNIVCMAITVQFFRP